MSDRHPASPRLREAIPPGAIAYLAGFVLVHFAGRVVQTEPPPDGVVDAGPPAGTIAQGHEAAGAVLYGSHGLSVSPWPGFHSANVLLAPKIALPGSPVPSVAWFLLPAAIVALGGYLLNERTEAPAGARTAIGRGSWIAYGYLPPFIIGGVVMDVAPLLVLVVGFVYPAVLGGLGGYLSYRF
jgi:hypothetical protein